MHLSYRTFKNLISTVTGHDYPDYIGTIENASENIYKGARTHLLDTYTLHRLTKYSRTTIISTSVVQILHYAIGFRT